MTISIIIATKTWGLNLKECINRCRQLDWDSEDLKIWVPIDTDADVEEAGKVFKVSHGNIGNEKSASVRPFIFKAKSFNPAHKRDEALKFAEGEFIAFIDDDAYPADRDWLKNALVNFKEDSQVAAVGGPAVTPPEDSLWQKASGLVYASKIVSAGAARRYKADKRCQADDLPSCNFIVRKSILDELGGFNTSFWPGEDTKLCLDIVKKLKKKIIYDPKVLVYHHRRPLFIPHLRQVASYALHRGYFVKRFPQTSRKAAYFIPSLFLVGLLAGGLFLLFFPLLKTVYLTGIFLYFLLVFCSSICRPARLGWLVFCGIIATHFTYGLYFLKGLFSVRLKEEL